MTNKLHLKGTNEEVDQSSQELEIKLASRREKRKSILSSLDQIVQIKYK